MNTHRFKKLLESTLGNVKPLLSEDVEPPIGDNPKEEKIQITPKDKEKVGNFLYDKIMTMPELHRELGVFSDDTKETVLDKLSHSHVHIDPTHKHLEVELPGFGVHHNFKPTFSLEYGSSHNDGHNTPHSEFSFTVGTKFSLGDLFNKTPKFGTKSHI